MFILPLFFGIKNYFKSFIINQYKLYTNLNSKLIKKLIQIYFLNYCEIDYFLFVKIIF